VYPLLVNGRESMKREKHPSKGISHALRGSLGHGIYKNLETPG
jgi:hypothetical protein